MIKKVARVFKAELAIEDLQETREFFFDFVSVLLESFTSISVLTLYSYLGNTLTLNKMALTTVMLHRLNHHIWMV